MTRSRDVSAVQNNLGVAIPPMAAGKNAVINGGFDIWQRGTSTSTSQAFAADRWQVYLGSGTATWSRQSVSDSTNLPNIQYCLRAQRNSGQTTTSVLYVWSNQETVNCIPFAGKTVTFSYYARAGANYSSASNALTLTIRRGTGTDQNAWLTGYTGNTETSATATLTTTWQRFTTTFTMPSDMTEFSPAFFYTPTGTAGANDYFEVTGVQLELGSSATPFSRAGGTIQGELAACQRYYQRLAADATSYIASLGLALSNLTTEAILYLYPKQTMRTLPTLAVSAVGNFYLSDLIASANYTPTAITLNTIRTTTNGIFVVVTVASGLTTGRFYSMQANVSTGYLELSAEL